MTALKHERSKKIKLEYVQLTATEKKKPAEAKEIIARRYYLEESTVHQILFDRKYGKRNRSKV